MSDWQTRDQIRREVDDVVRSTRTQEEANERVRQQTREALNEWGWGRWIMALTLQPLAVILAFAIVGALLVAFVDQTFGELTIVVGLLCAVVVEAYTLFIFCIWLIKQFFRMLFRRN